MLLKIFQTPLASEAYFTYYTYPEYLQGDRTTIKHLQSFTDRYKESPFLIDAHYLMGLDYKEIARPQKGAGLERRV